jgi:uncharacterized membrane protein
MLIGPIFGLLALIGLLAIFIWLVRLFVWLVGMARGYERARASRFGFRRSRQPIDILEERLVTGEIDAAEFEEKRSLLLTDTGWTASAIVDRRGEMASGHAE